jgi:predicted ATPase
MGGGKSTILQEISKLEYKCITEPARQILKEQRTAGKNGTPDKNPALFNELMLEKMISDYESNLGDSSIIIFDRGIADVVAYAELLKTDKTAALKAANEYKYNCHVFMFDAWEEIYTNDDERKMSFELSVGFAKSVRNVYMSLGYEIVDVPFVSIDERVEFIMKSIQEFSIRNNF